MAALNKNNKLDWTFESMCDPIIISLFLGQTMSVNVFVLSLIINNML